MNDLAVGLKEDEDGNITLITNHEGEPREIVLGKLSPTLVAILFHTAEFLETSIDVSNATIH